MERSSPRWAADAQPELMLPLVLLPISLPALLG